MSPPTRARPSSRISRFDHRVARLCNRRRRQDRIWPVWRERHHFRDVPLHRRADRCRDRRPLRLPGADVFADARPVPAERIPISYAGGSNLYAYVGNDAQPHRSARACADGPASRCGKWIGSWRRLRRSRRQLLRGEPPRSTSIAGQVVCHPGTVGGSKGPYSGRARRANVWVKTVRSIWREIYSRRRR